MTSKAYNKNIYHSAFQRNNTPSNTQWYNVPEIKSKFLQAVKSPVGYFSQVLSSLRIPVWL